MSPAVPAAAADTGARRRRGAAAGQTKSRSR